MILDNSARCIGRRISHTNCDVTKMARVVRNLLRGTSELLTDSYVSLLPSSCQRCLDVLSVVLLMTAVRMQPGVLQLIVCGPISNVIQVSSMRFSPTYGLGRTPGFGACMRVAVSHGRRSDSDSTLACCSWRQASRDITRFL